MTAGFRHRSGPAGPHPGPLDSRLRTEKWNTRIFAKMPRLPTWPGSAWPQGSMGTPCHGPCHGREGLPKPSCPRLSRRSFLRTIYMMRTMHERLPRPGKVRLILGRTASPSCGCSKVNLDGPKEAKSSVPEAQIRIFSKNLVSSL